MFISYQLHPLIIRMYLLYCTMIDNTQMRMPALLKKAARLFICSLVRLAVWWSQAICRSVSQSRRVPSSSLSHDNGKRLFVLLTTNIKSCIHNTTNDCFSKTNSNTNNMKIIITNKNNSAALINALPGWLCMLCIGIIVVIVLFNVVFF